MLTLSKMLLNKKSIQKFFKFIIQSLFKFIYGEIKEKLNPDAEKSVVIKKTSIEKNFSYKLYMVKNGRLYTDTIHDTAIIFKNKIIEGASFQLRDNKNVKCEENVVFTKGTPRIKKNISGTVLSLLTGGGGNSNYWHWLFDVLPRIEIVKNFIRLEKIDYFLFPDLKEKFQNQTLDCLGISREKRLSSRNHRHFSADEIIVTDHPYNLLNDPDRDSLNIPDWIILFLRKNFLISEKGNGNFPKKFFIDRSDSKSGHGKMRSIINEKEIRKLLEDMGFKFLVLSEYDFKDQIKLFNQAECIVGLHGAGFANVVFSRPNTKIIELQSDTAGEIIKNISEKNNLNYKSISMKPTITTENQLGHIKINVNILKEKILK